MTTYDVVVIGGGIHGVGVAQAAAAAGYKVLLLEQTQLAAGTSSRSSKLIHGGLRYLESGQFRLVRESLHERELLLRLAPELVRLRPFYIPLYLQTSRAPWQIRAGLSLYALLGNLAKNARFSRVPRNRWSALDGLEQQGLKAVFQYYDAQTDDAALTQAVMNSAIALGAQLICPAHFLGAVNYGAGYEIRYACPPHSQEHHCQTRALVNAAGPWVNVVLKNISPVPPSLEVDLVQGTHLIISGRLSQGIYYLEAPQDRRAVFVMPWQEQTTLVGTTETHYQGDPAAVQPLASEIVYLQKTLQHYFPRHTGTLLSSFAGLRVLPKGGESAFNRPRETLLLPNEPAVPRLISIYGGKLTGYRVTAAKVLALLQPALLAKKAIADTAHLMLTPP